MKHIEGKTTFFDVKEFNENPGPFCMSYGFDIDSIISSIKEVGLINKPYVRRNKDGRLDIVTGYRRTMASKYLNQDNVPCIELIDSNLSDRDLLILNLYDNLCTRRFNHVEKGMILNRLLTHFSMDKIYEHYMKLLDISSRREVDTLIKIEAFGCDVKDTIAEGSLSINIIESLSEIKDPSLTIVFKFISELKLNFNQQMLFMEYIKDISIKEKIKIHELLNEKCFQELMMESERNTPQRAKRLIELLRSRRFPVLIKNEKAFAGMISGLKLPKSVRIKHPPFFEAPDYLLEISFKDGRDLKKSIDDLSHIRGLPEIKDPWKEE